MRSPRLIAFVIGGVILVSALYVVLRPEPQISAPPNSPAPVEPVGPVTEPQPPSPAMDEFTFTVQGGQVAKPNRFRTTQGRKVLIRVTSDVADELHLHGYDYAKELVPNESVELRFTAGTAGRFELELEHRKLTLGFLEVQPK